MQILDRNKKEDVSKLNDLEEGITNKWRWEWLEKIVEVDPSKKFPNLPWCHGPVKMVAKYHIRKIDEPGKAVCSTCANYLINYAVTGSKSITAHLGTKKHIKMLGALYDSQMLPGVSGLSDIYGDVPPTTTPRVHISDRVANMEAMIVAFLAENSLSFTISEGLIELSKELSKDPNALEKLKLHRTTASYKLTYGLSVTWQNELVENLKKTPFSLNMDESTSSNTKHVFTVLVSYYNSDSKDIVVDHLGSIDVPSCTSENIFAETKKLFKTKGLSWDKLLAVLADSASTMRGKRSGVETLIRNKVAPHLLDIDGESCHHMHNIVKKFTSFFDFFLENLYRDVSNEFKLSADSLDLLKDLTFYMNMKFRKPINYHMCRWLSVYDTSIEFHNFVDVHTVFFSACEKADIEGKVKRCNNDLKKLASSAPSTEEDRIKKEEQEKKLAKQQKKDKGALVSIEGDRKKKEEEDKKLVKQQKKDKGALVLIEEDRKKKEEQDKKLLKKLKKDKRAFVSIEEDRKEKEEQVLKNLSGESRTVIEDHLAKRIMEKFKTGTEKGRERKRRIISSLLHNQNYYTLLTAFHQTVLPIFKSYVMTFQSDRPIIHKVYFKQVSLVKKFMSYFVKPDVVEKCKRGKHFLEMNLKESLLPKDLMFIGFKGKKLIEKLGSDHPDVVKFLNKVEESYLKCGEYIQNKLPLENPVLKAISVIDPLTITSPTKNVLKSLLSLPTYLTTVLTEEEEVQYDEEVRAVCVDSNLPAALDNNGNEVECLTWWMSISERYPVMFVMIRSVLSIFHGPRVESTFNVMGDVIDKNSGRMNMETYSSIQDVKYGLKARKPLESNRAVKLFSRENRHFTPINPQLTNNMRKSYKKYNTMQKKQREDEKKWRKKFDVENQKSITAKKLKENTAALVEKESEQHQDILAKAYNLKRLCVQDVKEDVEAKDSNNEGNQSIAIDEDRIGVQVEPVQLEEVLDIAIDIEESLQVEPPQVVSSQVISLDEGMDSIQDSASSSNCRNKSKRGGSSQISVPSKKRKKYNKLQKSINRYFKSC